MEQNRIDLRTLTTKAREKLRRDATYMHERGDTHTAIALELGIRRPTVSGWFAKSKAGAVAEIRPRGRPKGSGKLLTPLQEKSLRKDIEKHMPEECGVDYALWDAQAAKALIKFRFGADVPVSTVNNYLRRWGFASGALMNHKGERNSYKFKDWLNSKYPYIVETALQEHAVIRWCDISPYTPTARRKKEQAISDTDNTLGRSVTSKMNLISATTIKSTTRFMVCQEPLSSAELINYFERLARSSRRKVFLISSTIRVSSSLQVWAWLKEHKERLELFLVPTAQRYCSKRIHERMLCGDTRRLREQRIRAEQGRPDSKSISPQAAKHLRAIKRLILRPH